MEELQQTSAKECQREQDATSQRILEFSQYAVALRACARGFSSSPPAGPELAMTAIKTIKYRDLDYDTAKKEVMGYFQERGEAYPSEIEEDLEFDYELVCQITEELKREGRMELL